MSPAQITILKPNHTGVAGTRALSNSSHFSQKDYMTVGSQELIKLDNPQKASTVTITQTTRPHRPLKHARLKSAAISIGATKVATTARPRSSRQPKQKSRPLSGCPSGQLYMPSQVNVKTSLMPSTLIENPRALIR